MFFSGAPHINIFTYYHKQRERREIHVERNGRKCRESAQTERACEVTSVCVCRESAQTEHACEVTRVCVCTRSCEVTCVCVCRESAQTERACEVTSVCVCARSCEVTRVHAREREIAGMRTSDRKRG